MTIAAAFVTTEGVLLCTDQQITAGASKLEGNKIANFEATWGNVVMAFAGNVDQAAGAFQFCERVRESVKADPIQGLDDILAQRYRDHVFAHPKYATGFYDYVLFVAIQLRGGDRARLYRATDAEFREIVTFDCAGAGEDAARDLLRYLYSTNGDFKWGVALAAYVVSHVGQRVQYCGGHPAVGLLRHDGRVDPEQIKALHRLSLHIENVGNWFVWECQKFLLHHALGTPDRFGRCEEALTVRAERVRGLWDSLKTLDPTCPEVPTPDQSPLPPWPELPGESDEF
jgi:20S proteasome alpha/beta subunit